MTASICKKQKALCLLLLTMLNMISHVSAYPSGAPTAVCVTRVPKHGNQAQMGPPPFTITLSNYSYEPSDEILVNITRNVSTAFFRGFLLVARRVATNADNEELLGSFVKFSKMTARGRSWYPKNMTNLDFNCLTHSDNRDKKSLLVTWKAPAQSVGDIAFSLTIVEEFSTFWVNLRSPIIKARIPSADPTFSGIIKINAPAPDEFDGCGKDYGCVMSPAFCSAPYHLNCDLVVSYQLDENAQTVTIKMAAITPGYLTLAFSNDRMMGNDSTTTCTMSKDKKFASLQHGYNPEFYNERHRITGYSNVQLDRISNDNRLYCQFTRPLSLGFILAQDNGEQKSSYRQFNWSLGVDTNWYVFVATGFTYDETDVVSKHSELPAISSSMITLRDKRTVYAYRIPSMVQAHGSLMLLAWLAFISIAMMTASYYKELFSKEFGGIKLWFHIHRSLVTLAYLAAVIAIVLMFVFLKQWSSYAVIHGILGLIAMGAATLQIFVGLLRPAPTHKNRPLFLWVHRILGPTTHAFAAAALIFTYWITILPYQLKLKLIIIICSWIAFHIMWHIITIGLTNLKTKWPTLLKATYFTYVIAIATFFSFAVFFVCSH